MEITDLQYLVAAADCGNFAEVAKLYSVNASTISRRIGTLEEDLGLSLFERSPSGVRLTAGGADVVVHARRVLIDFEAVKSSAARNALGGSGEVRLGLRIPPAGDPLQVHLKRWRLAHPAVGLSITELSDRDMAGAIISRSLDAVFIQSFSLWPHAAALEIYSDRFVVAVPHDHPLATAPSIRWASFAGETIQVQGWDNSHAQRQFFKGVLGSGARFRVHTASQLTTLALVGAGFGLVVVPRSLSVASVPGVVFREIDETDAVFSVHLAWNPNAEDPAVGRFVAFMRDQARLLGTI